MRIAVEALSWSVSGVPVLRGIDGEVRSGETVGLIGPNGSGKSSLLRCIAGLRAPTRGVVRYDGEDIAHWSRRRIARQVAFVEQVSETAGDLRVADVVALGRTPFRDRWRDLSRADRAVVEAALARLGLGDLGGRVWKTLSGGERQRAHIARALAQQPWGLLLDEPTNHLDVRHQFELMELVTETDQTVLVALHDLALAARFCDRVLLLDGGELVAAGPPQEVLTGERLREVFGIEAELDRDRFGNVIVACRGAGRPRRPPVESLHG